MAALLQALEHRALQDRTLMPLLTLFQNAGYDRIEPKILQEAGPFLDLGGEDIRASLYFTSDQSGAELCLRPEFTIPVCRAHLASGQAGASAQYCYSGPVFRLRAGEPHEFVQAGLESFGREDTAAADAETLGLALESSAAAGAGALTVTFGDAGLLSELLDGLRLPGLWQRRLKRGLDRGQKPADVLTAAPTRAGDHEGVLAALSGSDSAGARALVDDLLSIAGITSVGGRTATEIAERFLAQVALRASPPFGNEQRAILDRYLSIAGHPDEAAAALRRLMDDARIDAARSLDLFEERTSFIAAAGVDLGQASFSGSFGRNLDYYTGFVFEARSPAVSEGPIFGGGRYDRLAQSLGNPVPVPAIGVSVWIDRLSRAGQEPRKQ